MFKKLIFLLGNLLAAVTAAGLTARFIPPDSWWPPAVIALLLPGLLLGTFLFVLYAGYQRKWSVMLFPAIVVVAALPLAGRLFAVSPGNTSSAASRSVTVITTNVRGFKNSAWQNIDPELETRFLENSQPDILLLQETKAEPHVARIRKASGLDKRHQPNRKTIATYANKPTFVADEFTNNGRGFNGFLVTDVETAIGTIRVINVHLQSNRISGIAEEIGKDSDIKEEIGRAESMFRRYGSAAATRANQAIKIRKFIEESPYPVIVGGDFNDVPSSFAYQYILTDRLQDAWSVRGFGIGTTFTGPLPFLRIDFLLVDKSLVVHEIEQLETGFSDHLGLRIVVGK